MHTSESDSPRSIILTDWSADVEYLAPGNDPHPVVWELMLHSMLRDEVLVQDEALVLSEKLANWFSTADGLRLLDELFEMGSLVVLKFPLSGYPRRDLKDQAAAEPILARSKYLQQYSTKGGEQFRPTDAQVLFHHRLDSLLRTHRVSQRQVAEAKSTYYSAFANRLSEILLDPRYRPWITSCIGTMSDRTREVMAECIIEPERAKHRIRSSKGRVLRGRFVDRGRHVTRSLLYRLADAEFPEDRAALRRLIQTAFAASLCHTEQAAGRYSAALRELLIIPQDAEAATAASVPVVRAGPVIRTTLHLPYPEPGFSTVIREIRETQPGKALRDVTSHAGAAFDFREQEHAWRAVAEELSQRLVRGKEVSIMHTLLETPRRFAEAGLAVGIVKGLHHLPVHDLSIHLQELGLETIAHGGVGLILDVLLKLCRTHFENQEFRTHLERAVEFRCSDVPLQN